MVTLTPTVCIDTREQDPLDIRAYPTVRATLAVGDYGIAGFSDWGNPAFIVERKSLPDLCASLGRERDRFLREVERMRGFRFRALVIEASEDQVALGAYRSLISPSAVLASLDCLAVRCGLHCFWCGDPSGAARKVESLARQFVGGVAKDYARLTRPDVAARSEAS